MRSRAAHLIGASKENIKKQRIQFPILNSEVMRFIKVKAEGMDVEMDNFLCLINYYSIGI